METPEHLHPAGNRLGQKLHEYEQTLGDLENYKAKSERAIIEIDTALANEELFESAVSELIQRSGIYKARIGSKETARTKLVKELKISVTGAHVELSNLFNVERTRRQDILTKRVISAGQLNDRFRPQAMDELLESSEAIMAIRTWAISSEAVLYTTETPEQIQTMAKRILAAYTAIGAKQKEQI
jgi:hypothetical protein